MIVETYKGHDIVFNSNSEHENKYEIYIELPILGSTAHGVRSVEEAKKLIDSNQ
jgi:hypothetical protein